jgi:O-methyltransferase involved in polyketide biosynthesis
MPQEQTLQPQSVQNTMFLPLWGRATVSRLYPGLLYDAEAIRIMGQLPYDFEAVAKSFGEYGMLNFAIRAHQFDDAIRRYLTNHPEAIVVNIGAGMDTTFSRIDNSRVRWYDLDLPDAIALRHSFIPEGSRNRCIAKSAFDYSWFDGLEYDTHRGVLFISGGVFYYLEPAKIKELVSHMAERFPGGLLLFDAESPLGISIASRMVKKTGNQGAEMLFAIKDPNAIKAWSPRIASIAATPYCQGIQRDKRWRLITRLGMALGDLLRMIWIINIHFKEADEA